MKPRPSWDEYFMEITRLVATRSTCLRRKVGAIIVKDKQILTTGYNGVPKKIEHCLDSGCLRERMKIPSGTRHELCLGIHAEQNAIVQAAVHGVSIAGAKIYCTHHPCIICAKLIINAGIQKVIIAEGYPDDLSEKLLKAANVEVITFRGNH